MISASWGFPTAQSCDLRADAEPLTRAPDLIVRSLDLADRDGMATDGNATRAEEDQERTSRVLQAPQAKAVNTGASMAQARLHRLRKVGLYCQEPPEVRKPDPKLEHETHRHPKMCNPREGATAKAVRRRLRGKQRPELRGGNEHAMGASSSPGVQVVRHDRSTWDDPSMLLSPGEVPAHGKLETSRNAPGAVRVSANQSGVPGVTWNSKGRYWRVQGSNRGKRLNKGFCVSKYSKPGMSEEEASNSALAAAIAFRRSQEALGTINMIKSPLGKGVYWNKKHGSWQVFLTVNAKSVYGGHFKPKDDSAEEVNFARRLAEERRRSLEKQYCRVEVHACENSEIRKKRSNTKDSEVEKKHEIGGDSRVWKKRNIEMLRHQLELLKTEAKESTVGFISRRTAPRKSKLALRLQGCGGTESST